MQQQTLEQPVLYLNIKQEISNRLPIICHQYRLVN